ncbi:MAG: condensation domain-containing protein, partial [Acidobacteriota bacterium]|nr:condensation domain-containing protein [Acidobacteriota bacterium]
MGQERAVYPLTSPQRDVWVHQMLHPTLPLYNIGCYTQINGAVDPALFKSAIEIVVRRHDSLRTLFLPGTEGLPKQIFLKDMAVTVPLHDFSSVRDPYAAALIWMKQQFVRPFSLFKAPLFEYAMLKVNARCYLWYYKYHHLIVDGWSASLLVRSVAETYTQLINGRKPSLEAPSYAAFVQDDLAYRKSKRYEASRCYWKNQYTSLPDPLFTPRDGYRLLPKTTPSNHLTLCLERSRFDRLKTLAANYKASVFHVLLGALYVYFTRTAQIEEFVVGLPALNRSGPQLKKTCGLFVGTNAARLRFGADLSFIDLVRDIGSMLKKNYRHQRFPISKLNQEVGIHQAGRKQLFDIILSYEKFDFDALFDSATSHTKTLFHGHEQTPLMICVHEHHDDGDVALDWVFNLAFFDPFEIEQIQARFALILEQVLDRFDMPVSALPLLTEADRRRLLALHRNTDEHERSSSTILDLFRQQAGESPDRTAMVFRGERITYGELNIRTNRLARHLAELRVRAEDRVGICVDRSLDVVIGPWGIMKA